MLLIEMMREKDYEVVEEGNRGFLTSHFAK